MEFIALFALLATFLYKMSQLSVLHLEWGSLHLEFKGRKEATWIKQEITRKPARIARPKK